MLAITTRYPGNFAASFGNNNKSLANGTFTAGITTTAEEEGAVATGGGTYAKKDYSNAQNYGTQALGRFSDAAGFHTIATNNAESVVGKFNQTKEGTLFQVGNGDDNDHRSNALEVYRDGHAEIQRVIDNELSVVNKGYVDNIKTELQNYVDIQLGVIENGSY